MLSIIDCTVRSKACFLSTANQMAMSLIETESERMMLTSCRSYFSTLRRSSNSCFFLPMTSDQVLRTASETAQNGYKMAYLMHYFL